MQRRIRLTFVAEGVSAEAELLDDLTPAVSAAVWDLLPMVGTSHHAIYSGSEAVMILPRIVRPPSQNALVDVKVGDLAFTFFEAGASYGVDEAFAEIAWFYDSDATPSMPEGAVALSVFGRIL